VKKLATAMLASWVSQATFNPPGLTVAVAKERAIESYLYEGDHFVLNILEEGKLVASPLLEEICPW
jgi:flavin reductase (DIM6/NTAB) family NADH-FMN oxidoreductase RutF